MSVGDVSHPVREVERGSGKLRKGKEMEGPQEDPSQ